MTNKQKSKFVIYNFECNVLYNIGGIIGKEK